MGGIIIILPIPMYDNLYGSLFLKILEDLIGSISNSYKSYDFTHCLRYEVV